MGVSRQPAPELDQADVGWQPCRRMTDLASRLCAGIPVATPTGSPGQRLVSMLLRDAAAGRELEPAVNRNLCGFPVPPLTMLAFCHDGMMVGTPLG